MLGAGGMRRPGAAGAIVRAEGGDGTREVSEIPAPGFGGSGRRSGAAGMEGAAAAADEGAGGITRAGRPDGREGNTRLPTRTAADGGGAFSPCLADSRKSAAACASSRKGLGGCGMEEAGADEGEAGDEMIEGGGAVVGGTGADQTGARVEDGRICGAGKGEGGADGRAELCMTREAEAGAEGKILETG